MNNASNASNAKNDGRALEQILEKTAMEYNRRGILRLTKVEPPVRVIGWGPQRKVIFLENPFGDFIGTWTERGGRMLMLEAKSTKESKLPFGSGGLTPTQIMWLKRWHFSGAAAGVLWEWVGHGIRFIPLGFIERIYESGKGRKHIKWEEADPVIQGLGFVLCDFVLNLRHWYEEKTEQSGTGDIIEAEFPAASL